MRFPSAGKERFGSSDFLPGITQPVLPQERVEPSVTSAYLKSVGTGCVSVVGCLPTVSKTLDSSTEKKGRGGGGIRREGEGAGRSKPGQVRTKHKDESI